MSSTKRFAVAFDLGTTTIAASLVDLAGGARVAALAGMNPQRAWGADVLARLEAGLAPDTLAAMQQAAGEELERMALELLHGAGAGEEELHGIALAGNTAMEQILLGLPVERLIHPPYLPISKEARRVSTRELGWYRDFPAYLFPLPGGFVGGDLVAFLFSRTLAEKGPTLYLDLGTNGEMALCDGERVLATSAAAGPAFEGGNLACGMAALPGAVSGVQIEGERVTLKTVGGVPPRGICGSGVLECVAELRDCGVLDPSGRLRPAAEIESNLANRVIEVSGVPSFLLYRDASRSVYLSQEDIRALQLAKGALRAGMEILLSHAGLSLDSLAEVVLTGSFGAVLSPEVLKKVGVFTEKMVVITGFARDGALAGVERFLAEKEGAATVQELAGRVRVIPLSGTPSFERVFLARLDFP